MEREGREGQGEKEVGKEACPTPRQASTLGHSEGCRHFFLTLQWVQASAGQGALAPHALHISLQLSPLLRLPPLAMPLPQEMHKELGEVSRGSYKDQEAVTTLLSRLLARSVTRA